ncbi:hypothetical protein L2E82_40101 [Cichorium intybus]|uniref:Uncharacterized protein n=1 Tax=Cichorium intybus TaxID=13427 RepID=A0ACB9AKF5_CICIN|nr:hypothetical protein L2E82_40101 [Cichorium intybus]
MNDEEYSENEANNSSKNSESYSEGIKVSYEKTGKAMIQYNYDVEESSSDEETEFTVVDSPEFDLVDVMEDVEMMMLVPGALIYAQGNDEYRASTVSSCMMLSSIRKEGWRSLENADKRNCWLRTLSINTYLDQEEWESSTQYNLE